MEEREEDDGILTVREVEMPTFMAAIPDDLMENLSKRDQHVLRTLSVMAQQVEWLMKVLIEQNSSLRSMEKRQIRVERWKNLLMSRWGVLVAILTVSGPYLLPRLTAWIFGK